MLDPEMVAKGKTLSDTYRLTPPAVASRTTNAVDDPADNGGVIPLHPDDPGPAEEPVDQSTSFSRPAIAFPKVWRARDLKPASQPRWLARNRIPKAAVSLLVGDEGIGKSLTWVWVAAPVTTGKPLPEFGIPARDPADVLIIATEDGWSDVILPRLVVAGADLDRVSVLCTDSDGSGAPVFPRDVHLILEADPVPALIVVDAWLDTVSSGLSVRDPQQARQALHPWKDLATYTDAAVLLVTHTNRVVSGNPRDRYGATGELRKKARMTLYAQTDDEGHLLVGPEKANSAAPLPASKFLIRPVHYFPPSEEHDGTVPLLTYAGTSTLTAREHLASSADLSEEPGGNPVKAFLFDYLMREGGEAKASDVLKAGKGAGFSDQELKDARRRHRSPRIESRKASGLSDGWVWAIVTEGGTTPEGGTKTLEGGEGGSQGGMPPSVPPSPPSEELPPSEQVVESTPPATPPGALTATSPGQTDRVARALANAQANLCPECKRAKARDDSGLCDLCTNQQQIAERGNQ